MLRRINI